MSGAPDPFAGAVPITTPGIPVYRERFLSDYTAPGRDVLGAQLGAPENFPSLQGVRTLEMEEAEGTAVRGTGRQGSIFGRPYIKAPDSPLLTPDDARAKLKERGLDGQIEIPDSGIRQRALDLLVEHRIEQNRRNAILARSPGGFALGAAGVVGTLAVSALDPLNVASAFLPVVGEARYAKLLAAAGESVLGRVAVRAGVGAVEGAVGGALVEPFRYAAAKAYQDDYTMNDALASLAFQGLFGATLHQLPAAAGWLAGKLRKGVPMEYQRAALSEALSAVMEDRAPRVSEMMEGIRRGDLMASTSLGRTETRFDPTEVRVGEPEMGTLRAPEEELRAARAAAVEARAREIEPKAFEEVDRLTKERETYTRWIDDLRVTRDKDLDEQIARTREQLEEAPNQRKAKIYQKRLDDLEGQRQRGDSPDMAKVRQKLQEADYRLRDLAPTVSAAKRRAEAEDIGPRGVNEFEHMTPDRDDLAAPGAMRAAPSRETFDAAMRATAPTIRPRPAAQDPSALTGVLTRIRDDRVNLPPDDARMAAETTRATPLYNKPATPEAAEAELTAYATATDEAVAVMQSTGRLTEADKALLVEADQMVAQAEYAGSGWKAATACIARAFT